MAKKYKRKGSGRKRSHVPDEVAEGTADAYGVWQVRSHTGDEMRWFKFLDKVGWRGKYLHLGVAKTRAELIDLERDYVRGDEPLRHMRRQMNGARLRRQGYGLAGAAVGLLIFSTPALNLMEGNGLRFDPVHGNQLADVVHLLGQFADSMGVVNEAHAALPNISLPSFELPGFSAPSVEQLSADDLALIAAAHDATRVVAQFRYAANTHPDDRVSAATLMDLGSAGVTAQGDLVTSNDAYTVLGGTFTATSILREFGLLRADGVLINMTPGQLAGELVGKSQLESGLNPIVEATHGRTLDGALGAFQIKPSTAFAVLAMHGHLLQPDPNDPTQRAALDGLVDPELRRIVQRGMALLADSPQLNSSAQPEYEQFRTRHNITRASVGTARGIAGNYNYDNPGRAASHSNLFYAAFELLPDADKQYIRDRLTETDRQIEHGNFSGARGVVLSGVMAGLLADQLNISQELVNNYGFRVFGYIGHQASPRAVRAIAGRLERRDVHPIGSPEWNRADFQLRRSILTVTNIRSNYPVYTTARAPRAFTEADIISWSALDPRAQQQGMPNIVDGISEKYGVTAGFDLPQAAADIYDAVNQGLVRLQRADYSGQGAFTSVALVESPARGQRQRQRQRVAQDFRPGEGVN